ncbi:uncharacterized protein PV06_01036 [Exophiala oligosperma]|uniref:Uncharacterized protein n=1 Tax=Exophiala oligosperma TaxID=215243 RepID=A0A0D2E0Z9_9EURO|nr:uncharacterized protein PV06_01036 [Exophiala oligosperma]KIW48455.1 hypothetical protein PV06_01036 [Exophiala oligosperma]
MTTILDTPSPLPGSFLPANEATFRCTNFNASLFLPPTPDQSRSTPTSSSLSQSLRNKTSAQTASRKRPRLDPVSRRDATSPPPLVNTNYRIAGGLDTPTSLSVQREEEEDRDEFEADCRPNRYTETTRSSYFPQTPAVNDDNKSTNGKRRLSQSPQTPGGWGKTVWALTGGIAGKVINFCWNTTFKGFHAGGGKGYEFDLSTPDVSSLTIHEVDAAQDVFHDAYERPTRGDRDRTPIPGGFPEEQSFVFEGFETARTKSYERRNDWVIVDGPEHDRDASPVRKKSRASTANLYARQPNTRQASSTQHPPRPRLASRTSSQKPSASYASPRSLAVSAAAAKPQHRRSVSSFEPASNTPRPNSRASMASPRRQSSQVHTTAQPSPEVRKFEQKMRRKEAKQDQTMNRFNAQLQAMIREGQQALGSKIEVVDGGMSDVDVDEGYEEGGEMMESWRS